MLLHLVENHVLKSGISNIFLMTRGQEEFYLKNGFRVCESSLLNGYLDFIEESMPDSASNSKTNDCISAGPPPPPLPTHLRIPFPQIIIASRTLMKKKLSS